VSVESSSEQVQKGYLGDEKVGIEKEKDENLESPDSNPSIVRNGLSFQQTLYQMGKPIFKVHTSYVS